MFLLICGLLHNVLRSSAICVAQCQWQVATLLGPKSKGNAMISDDFLQLFANNCEITKKVKNFIKNIPCEIDVLLQ